MPTTLEWRDPRPISAAPTPEAQDLFGVSEGSVRTTLELIGELYNYNHWLFNKVRPFIRGHVCEVGSGLGNITQFLLNAPEVVGLEPSEGSFRDLRQRFSPHLNVRFVRCRLEDCPGQTVRESGFDTVLCMNVLEHIADDVDALRRMRRLCRPAGRVVILVPAHMCIYGRLDRSVGHYRRYTRHALGEAFRRAGLDTSHSFYINALGFFGWWWQSCWQRREQISPGAARTFNRLVPFIDAAERLVRLPFGQSLIAVGTPAD